MSIIPTRRVALFWGSAYTPGTSHLNLSQLVPAASAMMLEDGDGHGRRQICPAALWRWLLLYAPVPRTPTMQLTQDSWIVPEIVSADGAHCLDGYTMQ